MRGFNFVPIRSDPMLIFLSGNRPLKSKDKVLNFNWRNIMESSVAPYWNCNALWSIQSRRGYNEHVVFANKQKANVIGWWCRQCSSPSNQVAFLSGLTRMLGQLPGWKVMNWWNYAMDACRYLTHHRILSLHTVLKASDIIIDVFMIIFYIKQNCSKQSSN